MLWSKSVRININIIWSSSWDFLRPSNAPVTFTALEVLPYIQTCKQRQTFQVSLFCLSPPKRLFVLWGGWGERKGSAQGTMGGGRREKRLPSFPSSHRSPRTFYFSIIAIFIGIPSGILCGGESCFVTNLVRGREPDSIFSTSAFSLPKFCIIIVFYIS